MESKYYVPQIEEFYVGFQYESFVYESDSWIKTNIDRDWDSCVIEHYINDLTVRVKYLDREDIESLGWEYKDYAAQGDGDIRWFDLYSLKGGFYHLSAWGHIPSLGDNLCDRVLITSNGRKEKIFDGKIKNKSELRILMSQLEIK